MPKRSAKARPGPDFIKIAVDAGEEAAKTTSLDGERVSPTEMAEDWYDQHGVPRLQKAADDAGTRVDVDDAKLKKAFSKAFVAAVKQRLAAKPASKAKAKSGVEALLAENGAAMAEDSTDDDIEGGLSGATDEQLAELGSTYFEDSGILDVAAGRARIDTPAEGTPEYLRLRALYVDAFIAALRERA